MPEEYIYTASGIGLHRHQRQVLCDVDIGIRCGELTGLIGPNSAGKSTLLDVLTGILIPDTGKIYLENLSLNDWSRVDLAKTVAYMPQQHLAHWPVTVYDYVSLGRIPQAKTGSANGQEDSHFINLAIDKTDVRHLSERPVTELSGGELSRVSLARTLAVNARVIMVDEPIAGLDPGHQLSIMQVLRDEARAGKAVVTVIHDLTMAGRFCDALWLMHHGAMHCSGAPAEVLDEDTLSEVYQVTSRVLQSSPREVIMPWDKIDCDHSVPAREAKPHD